MNSDMAIIPAPARAVDHRSVGLDFMRALAAMLVMVFHLRTMLVVDFGPLNPVIEGGNSGVFIFFALSGYLLYKPFVRGAVDLRSYAIKRAARILPGYFVALIALGLLTRNQLLFDHPLPYLSMTASYHIPLRGFLGNAWTLSAEILFYVALPAIALLVRGAPVLRLTALALVSVALGLWYRIVLNDDILWMIGTFPFVYYAFVPGMVLAVVEVQRPGLFLRLGTPAMAAVGTALLLLGCITMADPIALPTGIGTILVMPWLVQHRFPAARAFAFAGGASYAVYLWHRDLFTSFGVLGVPITIVGSALSWMLIERPVLDWAHRAASRLRRQTVPPDPVAVSPATGA